MKSFKVWTGVGLVVLGLAVVLYVWRVPLSLRVAERVASHRLAMDPVASLPDGLHVGVCGSGSPFPDDKRAGPCTLVLAGKRLFVFDAGSASVKNIGKLGFSHGRIEAIFLTHFHSDHIDGLGELLLQRWASAANTVPVDVHGPIGVDQVVQGLMQAYGQDRYYRVTHHGDATVPSSGFGARAKAFQTGDTLGQLQTLVQDADVQIAAFSVDHAPVHPSVGYLIRYKGRSVVLSGDTKQSKAIEGVAQGADLLVHEALSPTLIGVLKQGAAQAGRTNLVKIFDDIIDYHTTPEQAAQTAKAAQVRFLLLNHIVPALPLPGLEAAFLGNADQVYGGPIRIAHDGDFLTLPVGSTAVNLSSRF